MNIHFHTELAGILHSFSEEYLQHQGRGALGEKEQKLKAVRAARKLKVRRILLD